MLSQPGFGNLRRSLPKWLWSAVVVLVGMHIAASIVHFRITGLPCHTRELFDLEENESFGQYFMTMILLFAGLLVLYHARRLREQDRATGILWLMLGVGFCVLSVEKVAGVHQIISSWAPVSWTALGATVAVLVGIAYVPFLLRLPASTRNLFIAAGALYLAGSIGIDFAAKWLPGTAVYDPCFDRMASLGIGLTTAIENAMEMSGMVLFINAMINIEA